MTDIIAAYITPMTSFFGEIDQQQILADVTDKLKEIYGVNRDWNNFTFYHFEDVFDEKEYLGNCLLVLYERKNHLGNNNYFLTELKDTQTLINPILGWPLSLESEYMKQKGMDCDQTMENIFASNEEKQRLLSTAT